MRTATYDLNCNQGATFDQSFRFGTKDPVTGGFGSPHDLTGRTFKMQVREKHGDDDILIDLSTENGGIILDGPDGAIRLIVPAEITTLLPALTGVYDIEMKDGSIVTRVIQGKFSISPEVTRD